MDIKNKISLDNINRKVPNIFLLRPADLCYDHDGALCCHFYQMQCDLVSSPYLYSMILRIPQILKNPQILRIPQILSNLRSYDGICIFLIGEFEKC